MVGARRSPRASRANFCNHGEIAAMAGMCAPTVMAKKVCQSLKDQTLSLRCGLVEQAMACVGRRLRRHGGNLAVLLPHLRLSFHTHHLTNLLRKVGSSIVLDSERNSVFIIRDTARDGWEDVPVFRCDEKHRAKTDTWRSVADSEVVLVAPPKQPHASYSFPLPRYTVGYMELLGISDCNVNLLCVLEVVILWLRPPKICSTIYPNNRHVTFSTEA